MRGLFADEELYSIELARIQVARAHARNRVTADPSLRPETLTTVATRAVKSVLPASLYDRARGLKDALADQSKVPAAKPKLAREVRDRLDAQKLHHRSKNLETALDFVAICRRDPGAFATAVNQFDGARR